MCLHNFLELLNLPLLVSGVCRTCIRGTTSIVTQYWQRKTGSVCIVLKRTSQFSPNMAPMHVFTFYQISNGITGFIVSDNVPIFFTRNTSTNYIKACSNRQWDVHQYLCFLILIKLLISNLSVLNSWMSLLRLLYKNTFDCLKYSYVCITVFIKKRVILVQIWFLFYFIYILSIK